MGGFVARRVLLLVPTIFGVTLLTFLLMAAAPGDPFSAMIANTPNADIRALRHAYGLDQPLPLQYIVWLSRFATGDFGQSLINRRPVAELVAAALPNTLVLSSLSALLSLAVGIPLGVTAAYWRGKWPDQMLRVMAVAGYALPSFWIGLIFILVFAVHLHVLPAGGASSIGTDSWDIVDKLRHLVGPVLILSLAGVSNFMRYVRTEMLDVLAEDYVRTARAKGLSEHHVISRHVLRASLLPVITAFGGMLAQLVSGALVVEQVFAWPGVGRLAFDAAQTHDAPVVLAVVVVVSIALLAGYSIRDLAYAIADPRIRNT